MASYNLVYEKFGIPIDKQMELDCLTHSKLLRDAICLRLQETEDGKEYLRDCWRLQQTEPDFEAIKKFNNMMNNK